MSITDEHDDDEAELFEPDDGDSDLISRLRKKAKTGPKSLRDRADQLAAENATLKSEKLLRTAGLDQLNERQQRAVLGSLDGEATVESLKAAAVDLGFIEADAEGAAADATQRQMADAAATAAAGQHKPGSDLTPAMFAAWDMPRRVDFMERHPEKMAALERGESVRV